MIYVVYELDESFALKVMERVAAHTFLCFIPNHFVLPHFLFHSPKYGPIQLFYIFIPIPLNSAN